MRRRPRASVGVIGLALLLTACPGPIIRVTCPTTIHVHRSVTLTAKVTQGLSQNIDWYPVKGGGYILGGGQWHARGSIAHLVAVLPGVIKIKADTVYSTGGGEEFAHDVCTMTAVP